MKSMLHRSLVAGAFALCLAPFAALAQAGDVLLFKIVSAKDEIVIGLPKARVDALGSGTPIEVVAAAMAKAGQFPAWQYGPRRDAQGKGQFSPVQRVVVFAPGVIRLESYTTDMPVAAPTN